MAYAGEGSDNDMKRKRARRRREAGENRVGKRRGSGKEESKRRIDLD